MEGLNITIDDDADSEAICAKINSRPLGLEITDLKRSPFIEMLVDRLTSGSRAFIKRTMDTYDVPEGVILDSVVQGVVQTRIDTCRVYIEDNHDSREEVVGELIKDALDFILYLEKTFKINSN